MLSGPRCPFEGNCDSGSGSCSRGAGTCLHIVSAHATYRELVIRRGGRLMKVKVHHNGDDVFIGWKPNGFIPDCRGFALLRRRNGLEEIVSTWVGFEDDDAK